MNRDKKIRIIAFSVIFITILIGIALQYYDAPKYGLTGFLENLFGK
jgi:hypothetical protein